MLKLVEIVQNDNIENIQEAENIPEAENLDIKVALATPIPLEKAKEFRIQLNDDIFDLENELAMQGDLKIKGTDIIKFNNLMVKIDPHFKKVRGGLKASTLLSKIPVFSDNPAHLVSKHDNTPEALKINVRPKIRLTKNDKNYILEVNKNVNAILDSAKDDIANLKKPSNNLFAV